MQSDRYLIIIIKSSMLFLLAFFLFSSIYLAEADYLYHFCSNATTFTRNSSYGHNLKSLLSSFSSSMEYVYYDGFKSDDRGSQPDMVYGLFLCRGDCSNDVCKDCVAQATKDIVQRCPREKVAVIWYDKCLLRYSNNSNFSVMETSPSVYMWNIANVTEQPERFNFQVWTTLGQIAKQAAYAPQRAKKFASQNVSFTATDTIYTMVQCTPDLPDSTCFHCLETAISQFPICCSGRPGGRVLTPSCNFRYEVYPFINHTAHHHLRLWWFRVLRHQSLLRPQILSLLRPQNPHILSLLRLQNPHILSLLRLQNPHLKHVFPQQSQFLLQLLAVSCLSAQVTVSLEEDEQE